MTEPYEFNSIKPEVAEDRYLAQIRKLEQATETHNLDKVADLLEQLPSARQLPKPFSDVVQKARRTYIFGTCKHDMKVLIDALREYRIETLREVLGRLPSSRNMPRPYKQFVKAAEKRITEEKRKQQITKEGENNRSLTEEKSFTVSNIEDLYSDATLKYKRIIAKVEELLEKGEDQKAKDLLVSTTITGAPNETLEQRIRQLKENLNVKYRKK